MSAAGQPLEDGYVLGLDLGGTRLKALAITPAGVELRRETVPTGGPDWKSRVLGCVGTFFSRFGPPVATGVAAPGLPTADGRSIACMPGRLPGLEELDWTAFLQSPVPVPVLNDAHAALLGEVWLGAAIGMLDVILLTLGTGVGGAILSDGHLLRGHLGRAGHFGHLSINSEGPLDIINTPGSLENAVGNQSIASRSGGRYSSTADLVADVSRGDATATEIWARTIRDLAAGITSLINILDPQTVLLGGGIAEAGDILFTPLATELDRVEWRPGGHRVRLTPARLGDWAGAHGAGAHALQEFLRIDLMTPTADFLAHSRGILDRVAAQENLIQQAAGWFTQTILAGRMVHVFGSGHSRMMVEEMWPRYGSFPGWNPIVELSLSFHNLVVGANGQRQAMFLENVSGLAPRILRNFGLDPVDTALIISSSGCNVVPIEMAEEFQRRGIKVVAIVSARHLEASTTRHPGGMKLTDFADLVLDTGAPAGDAMIYVPNLDTPVAPGSTLGGCLLINSIKAEVAARLTAAGQPPKVLSGAMVVGPGRAAELFESAYDEHSHRLAKLYAGAGPF